MIDLPFKAILFVAFLNVLLFFILKLVKRYLFVFIKSEEWGDRITQTWGKITLVLWGVLWVLSIIFLLNKSFWTTVVLLALFVIIGGRYWRDIIAGLTIKFEDRISEGDYLTKDEYEGVIQNIGFRGIMLHMKNGENAFIPFRNITEFKVRKLDREVKNELNTVLVKFKPEISMDAAIDKLRIEMLQIPYTILTQSIQIEVIDVEESGTTVRAVLHTQSSDSGKLAEKALLSTLRSQKLLV